MRHYKIADLKLKFLRIIKLSQCLLSQVLLQAVDSDGISFCVKLVGKEVMLLKHPLQVSSTIHTYSPDMAALALWVHSIQWKMWALMPLPLNQPRNCINVWHVEFLVGPCWARYTRDSLNGCPEEFIRTVGVLGPLNKCLYSDIFQHTLDISPANHNVGISWQNGQVEGRRLLFLSSPLRGLRKWNNALIWW